MSSVTLITDTYTTGLVEIYALRAGISRNEALRRLVRIGLGLDPLRLVLDHAKIKSDAVMR